MSESTYPFEITGRPDYAYLTVQVPADQMLKVEASAMATMDTNLRMKTRLKGGFRRMLTRESLFINEFTAEGGPGQIQIAPGPLGDLDHVHLEEGEEIFLQNSAYVASTPQVDLQTKWQGFMKGFFSGESFFLIRCVGPGDVWFNTYGAMIRRQVESEYVVDTGHIVAFTPGLEYNIEKFGGYKSLFFSGEGLICRFRGEGQVWIQTRQVPSFAAWVHPYRRVKSNS
ncbi:MAG: TIGR00266 family protein [Phycisphaeraceae bacterium]|nr:TIGR00266 family protein [Phycisphaeraceae bacterium]